MVVSPINLIWSDELIFFLSLRNQGVEEELKNSREKSFFNFYEYVV